MLTFLAIFFWHFVPWIRPPHWKQFWKDTHSWEPHNFLIISSLNWEIYNFQFVNNNLNVSPEDILKLFLIEEILQVNLSLEIAQLRRLKVCV